MPPGLTKPCWVARIHPSVLLKSPKNFSHVDKVDWKYITDWKHDHVCKNENQNIRLFLPGSHSLLCEFYMCVWSASLTARLHFTSLLRKQKLIQPEIGRLSKLASVQIPELFSPLGLDPFSKTQIIKATWRKNFLSFLSFWLLLLTLLMFKVYSKNLLCIQLQQHGRVSVHVLAGWRLGPCWNVETWALTSVMGFPSKMRKIQPLISNSKDDYRHPWKW